MFRTALDHYIEKSVGARIRRCETLPLREGIRSFFDDIRRRSLGDHERKGCMIVNSEGGKVLFTLARIDRQNLVRQVGPFQEECNLGRLWSDGNRSESSLGFPIMND
jgi:hypothetical protein